MNKKLTRYTRRFVRYIRRTWKNKLLAIAAFVIGIVAAKLTSDGTLLLFVLMTFGPIFFARNDCFYQTEEGS